MTRAPVLLLLPATLLLAACANRPLSSFHELSVVPPSATFSDTTADKLVRKNLENNLREILAEAQPLEKVITFLQHQLDAPIDVRWSALEHAGISRKTPVTIWLQHVPVRKALTAVLREVGDGTADLGYTIHNGAVVISTRKNLHSAEFQTTITYDLGEFALSVKPGKTPQDAAGELADIIQSSIARDTWQQNGGTVGWIRIDGTQFTIRQTHENQRAIRQFLDQVRLPQARRAPFDRALVTVEVATVPVTSNDLDRVVRPLVSKTQPYAVLDAPSAARLLQSLTPITAAPRQHKPGNTVTSGQYSTFDAIARDHGFIVSPALLIQRLKHAGASLGFSARSHPDGKSAICKAQLTLQPRPVSGSGNSDAPLPKRRFETEEIQVPRGSTLVLVVPELPAQAPTTAPSEKGSSETPPPRVLMLITPTHIVFPEMVEKLPLKVPPPPKDKR